jgi:hypothetical protein
MRNNLIYEDNKEELSHSYKTFWSKVDENADGKIFQSTKTKSNGATRFFYYSNRAKKNLGFTVQLFPRIGNEIQNC